MRIPGNNGPERPGATDRARSTSSKKTAESSTSSGGGASTGGVTASVSAKARSLAADHGMEVGKVERLRDAIQSGEFKMDFALIAQRIVDEGA